MAEEKVLGEEPDIRGGARCQGRSQVLEEGRSQVLEDERRGRNVEETKASSKQFSLSGRNKNTFWNSSLTDRNNNKVSTTLREVKTFLPFT